MKTKFTFAILCFCVLMLSCGQTAIDKNKDLQSKNALSKKDTCEGPDANINCSFINIPDSITPVMNIAPKEEPGERLIITGKVYRQNGSTPFEGVLIYAYHTDNDGLYSKKGNETGAQKFHGHLHGWCKTDSNGHYEIHSIRPSRYPGNTAPAHIHSAIKITETSEPVYINDFVFSDDALVNENYLKRLNPFSGSGVIELRKNSEGLWIGERDIVLEMK